MKKVLSILLLFAMLLTTLSVAKPIAFANAASTPSALSKVSFNGHLYAVYDSSLSWSDAQEFCESVGGHLVTITSQEEQDFLIELAKNSTKRNLWIGAKINIDGAYAWVTGENFTYTNWASGEPNNVFNSQYTAMMYTQNASYPAGSWNDENENGRDWYGYELSNFGFICEWNSEYRRVNGFNFYMNYPSNYIPIGTTVELHVGYYTNDILNTAASNYIYAISDSSVLTVSDSGWSNTHGQILKLKAKQVGSAIITVTNPKNGKSAALEIFVTSNESGWNFYNIPKMTIEAGRTTNFYNYSGLVVDEFAYQEQLNSDGTISEYTVTMQVFNSINLYGVVTAHRADGSIYDYYVLDKMSNFDTSFVDSLKSLYYNSGDLYYLIQNEQYYSGVSISKQTDVEINVPAGGYITISNNVTTSDLANFVNYIGLVVDVLSLTNDLVDAADTKYVIDDVKSTVINNIIVNYLVKEQLKDGIISGITSSTLKTANGFSIDIDNIADAIRTINNDLIQKLGINLVEEIEEEVCSVMGVLSIGESVLTKVIPTGWIIEIMYGGNAGLDFTLFFNNYLQSKNRPSGIHIYAPTGSSSFQSNGVIVDTNEDSLETVIHSYTVISHDSTGINNNTFKNQAIYYGGNFQTHSITLFKDGVETQPSTAVTVKIPISKDFNKTNHHNLKVYRNNEDGTLTDMNARLSGDYLIFETDHFSFYSVVDESDPTLLPELTPSGINTVINDDLSVECSIDNAVIEEYGLSNYFVEVNINGIETIVTEYTSVDETSIFNLGNILPTQTNGSMIVTVYAELDGIIYASEETTLDLSEITSNVRKDIDLNGVVDSADVLKHQQLMLGIRTPNHIEIIAADINADGIITASDYLQMQLAVLNQK